MEEIKNNYNATIQLNSKKIFLTYPRVRGDVDLGRVRDNLTGIIRRLGGIIKFYYIGLEKHHEEPGEFEGRPYHWHVLIVLLGELRRKVPSDCFDIDGNHPNIQGARSIEAVAKYCTKDGTYITNDEVGLAKYQTKNNKKTDAEIGQELLSGKSLQVIVEENPRLLLRYPRVEEAINLWRMHTSKHSPMAGTCGIWIGGTSGAGKSTIAHDGRWGATYSKENSIWFTGIKPTDRTILFDDFDKDWNPLLWTGFKKWADKFPTKVQVHGSQLEIRPAVVLVTSNFTIEELANHFKFRDATPWTRRFKEFWITHWTDWEWEDVRGFLVPDGEQ